MVTDAKRRANRKYDALHMTVLGCKVRKDYADQIRAEAKARGTTVNAILLEALRRFMAGEE